MSRKSRKLHLHYYTIVNNCSVIALHSHRQSLTINRGSNSQVCGEVMSAVMCAHSSITRKSWSRLEALLLSRAAITLN